MIEIEELYRNRARYHELNSWTLKPIEKEKIQEVLICKIKSQPISYRDNGKESKSIILIGHNNTFIFTHERVEDEYFNIEYNEESFGNILYNFIDFKLKFNEYSRIKSIEFKSKSNNNDGICVINTFGDVDLFTLSSEKFLKEFYNKENNFIKIKSNKGLMSDKVVKVFRCNAKHRNGYYNFDHEYYGRCYAKHLDEQESKSFISCGIDFITKYRESNKINSITEENELRYLPCSVSFFKYGYLDNGEVKKDIPDWVDLKHDNIMTVKEFNNLWDDSFKYFQTKAENANITSAEQKAKEVLDEMYLKIENSNNTPLYDYYYASILVVGSIGNCMEMLSSDKKYYSKKISRNCLYALYNYTNLKESLDISFSKWERWESIYKDKNELLIFLKNNKIFYYFPHGDYFKDPKLEQKKWERKRKLEEEKYEKSDEYRYYRRLAIEKNKRDEIELKKSVLTEEEERIYGSHEPYVINMRGGMDTLD